MAEVIKFLQPKCTFLAFGLEAMLAKLSEDPAKVPSMFFSICRKYQNVIKIHGDKDIQVCSEDIVHQPLES